jgi:hypothetical protein
MPARPASRHGKTAHSNIDQNSDRTHMLGLIVNIGAQHAMRAHLIHHIQRDGLHWPLFCPLKGLST